MKRTPKILAYLLSCTLLLGASLAMRDTNVTSAKADASPNSTFVKVYDDNPNWNNTAVSSGFNQVLIVYSGTAHGLGTSTLTDNDVLNKVSLNGTSLDQLSGSSIITWDGQPWFRVTYPNNVTTGDVLEIQSGLTFGACVMDAFKLRLNENSTWDYYFGETVNATYNGIYSDDFNNGTHATGYNRILIKYKGTAHGNPSAIISANDLKKYNAYVFINDNPLSAYAGGSTQIAPWGDQLWIQFIYPASAVSIGSVLTIKSGCKVGNAVLGRMVFELNSSEKWEISSAEYQVTFSVNGGTGTMEPVGVELGDYTLPACDFTAPENKHFAGWKVDGSGATLQPGETVNITKSISLVAQWEVTKTWVTYSGIAGGWNNAHYNGTPAGYNQLILSFGTHGVDYLAVDHIANATNRATTDYDIGTKLTINGVTIAKIHDKYPDTHVGYDHGFAYFYVQYPADLLTANKNTLVPTIHIENGAEFMDSILPEVTLKFAGGVWVNSSIDEFKLDNPIDVDSYLFNGSDLFPEPVTLPHTITNNANPILEALPVNGCEVAFTLNTGDIGLTDPADVVQFAFYKFTINILLTSGTIQLLESDYSLAQEFSGYAFAANTDYTIEFSISCGSSTTVKFAINHALIINHTFDADKSGEASLYAVDSSNCLSIDYYKEVEMYKPHYDYGYSSCYDFIEGDDLYNFAELVSAADVYNDSVTQAALAYDYEEGAVTNNKYNAGKWTLTVTITIDGHDPIIKEISINVHGKVSTAKISYDDGDPIEVPVGSKLVAPTDPQSYREGEYEYYFSGWYFEGAKWDFENDVVQGNMNLYSHFKTMPYRYQISVSFEGLDIPDATYLLAKNNSLPFELFELEGATFEVFKGNNKITSLIVQEDVQITVKYTVVYTHVEGIKPTCTDDGNLEYWYSAIYPGYYFADAKGRELIKDPVLSKLNHDIVHLEYKDSTCAEAGNVDCYYCNNCHKHFSDENGENELINWEIAKKSHTLTHHNAVEATCSKDGNVEYWTCENEPGTYYGDKDGNTVLDTIVINAVGHDYGVPTYTWKETENGYECTASAVCEHCQEKTSETQVATKVVIRSATCSQEGQISYSVKFDNPLFNTQNKIVITEKTPHTYVHVDEVKATKNKDGVKEHYECSECHKFFVLNNGEYIEVEFNDLIIKYKKSAGCGGSITAPSLIILVAAGAFFTLVMLRRKEEN